MSGRLLLILCFFVSSCGFVQKFSQLLRPKQNNPNFIAYSPPSVTQHLRSLGKDYIETYKGNILRLNKGSRDYLNSVYQRITRSNELLLDKKFEPNFFIIKNDIPFYFSLPGAQIFLSSGLLLKYLKNEELLVSVLAYEIIRTHRNIYKNGVVVPIGYILTRDILNLTTIPLETKKEVNKWVFYCLKRAQFDGYAYLSWLQLQNKYTLEFSLQNTGGNFVSQEEFLFKDFLVKEGLESGVGISQDENSSKQFYKFIRNIKKKVNET